MTIGIDVRSLMEGKKTGIEEYMHELLHQLFQLDQKNSYRLFYNSYHEIAPHVIDFDYPNVTKIRSRIPNKVLNLLLKFAHWPKIDNLLGGVDILFVPNFRISSVSASCKKILTVHDLSFELFPEFFSLKRKLWHKFVDPTREVRESHSIIAVSEHTKQHLMHTYNTPQEKIVVSYPGFNHMFTQAITPQEKSRVLQTYNLPEKFLLYVGTLEPRKNIEGIVTAFAHIQKGQPNMSLVIAGGKGWLYDDMFALIEKLDIKKHVHILGFIPEQDKRALYQIAHTFIYPSFFEGFGFPILEALVSHQQPISSTTSSMPEVAGTQGILVNPYDIGQIRAALNLSLNLSIAEKPLTSGQINEFEEQFNWKKSAETLLELFEQLNNITGEHA